MKVDFLTIHFTTYIIPSRTKHESFDSFGSHAPLWNGIDGYFPEYFGACSLFFVCTFQCKDIETNN